MIVRKIASAVVFAALLSALTAYAAGAPTPSPKDKCPVCGMFVAKYPDWTAVITFRDGTSQFFDGAKDMFTYYHAVRKYSPKRDQASMSSITVRDYYALKQIDARTAFFVIGSDVSGPMGHELIPFAKEADAREFLKDHKGKKIVRFNDVSAALAKGL